MIKGSLCAFNQEGELGKLLLIGGKLSSTGSIVFTQILHVDWSINRVTSYICCHH